MLKKPIASPPWKVWPGVGAGGVFCGPMPTVTATQGNRSSLPSSTCCHIWKNLWIGSPREGAVRHVLRDLEGAVRQVGGKARIGNAGRHADGVGGLGLREGRVAPRLRGGEHVDA